MNYNLGNIKDIPPTGDPLGEDIINQLEKLGTPISHFGWTITESSNGDSLLHTNLDNSLKNFLTFQGAFTYVMGRGITQEEVIKYEEWLAMEH
jgi:hypothetical protein